MNFIVALLLRHIPDQEDAFWALVYVMFELNWREIFDETSAKIAVLLDDLQTYI